MSPGAFFRRRYSELAQYGTFLERYRYLALQGQVGATTFGHDRYINQGFYRSREWRNTRHIVIARDRGCDLGLEGFEIHDKVLIHHMNPLAVEDLIEGHPDIMDPEFLISVSHRTHNAIHYGDERQLPSTYVPRSPGDTKLWSR